MNSEEAAAFVHSLDADTSYYIDLFTHRNVYGLETVGLMIAAMTGKVLDDKALRRVVLARRKVRPPDNTTVYVL